MPRPRALTWLARGWGVVPLVLVVGLLGLRACLHVDPRTDLPEVATIAGDPEATHAQTGSLYVARGGPLIVGFQSNHVARLTVAGHELRGAGVIKDRIIVPAGPLAFRFAARPDARLVWSPVGRRGDPEYIPASSVSPDPPATATFGTALDPPGTAVTDGLIALALLLVLIGSLLMLARGRLAAVPRATWLALGATFALALIVRLLDLGGAGQTWDEDVNWAAGRNYVTNVLALDFSPRAWTWNFEHPPVMKLLDGIGAQLADGFGPARALSAIWISLGCALLVPIGARLYRLRVGVLAAVIAALLPPLVAHGQVVGHESPTVLWWALGILLSLGVHDELPGAGPLTLRRLQLRLVAVGAVVGIAVASRFVNGLLGPLCVLIVLVRAPRPWRRETVVWTPLMVLASIAAFVVVWPRLWFHPIEGLQASLAKLSASHALEPFLGQLTNHPAPYYFLVYLYATAPLGVLVGVACGAARATVERSRSALILAAWFVIPLGVAASPVRQDGVRYVMPCLLALCLCAATGADAAVAWLERKRPAVGARAFPALGAVFALYLGVTVARTHPYYLDYFGEQVGGAGGVEQRRWMETGWWGEGVDRAVAYVNEHAAPGAHVFRDCILPGHLAWFRDDLWATLAPDPRQADWIVTYSPVTTPCRLPPDATKVFEVTADGAVLAQVYSRPTAR